MPLEKKNRTLAPVDLQKCVAIATEFPAKADSELSFLRAKTGCTGFSFTSLFKFCYIVTMQKFSKVEQPRFETAGCIHVLKPDQDHS